mmetsp:Transcript_93083/g.208341  ORF Transcript_93083/g.208341 Transcript_93083/m.208341 type:complete len:224 (-) Transcript_93083:159-830(-)
MVDYLPVQLASVPRSALVGYADIVQRATPPALRAVGTDSLVVTSGARARAACTLQLCEPLWWGWRRGRRRGRHRGRRRGRCRSWRRGRSRHPYPARVVGHGRLRVRDGLEMALAAVWPPVFVGDAMCVLHARRPAVRDAGLEQLEGACRVSCCSASPRQPSEIFRVCVEGLWVELLPSLEPLHEHHAAIATRGWSSCGDDRRLARELRHVCGCQGTVQRAKHE